MGDESVKLKINKLAVAEFKKFCKSNALDFFIPDQHPDEQADPDFIHKQFPLANEAISLFNRTKPRIYLDDSVIEFNFASWMPGDIDYNINTVASLISERDSTAGDLEKMKKAYRFFVVFGSISLLVLSACIINKLVSYFDPFGEYNALSILLYIPMLGALFLESFVKKAIKKLDDSKKEAEKDKFERDLTEIRIKLGLIYVVGQKMGKAGQLKNPTRFQALVEYCSMIRRKLFKSHSGFGKKMTKENSISYKKTDSKEAVALFREKMKRDRGIEISEEKARAILKDLDSYFNK